jgi:hypothetical protein
VGAVKSIFEFVGAMLLTCLSARHRKRWLSGEGSSLRTAALASGLAEAATGLAFVTARFVTAGPSPPLAGPAGGFSSMPSAVFDPLNIVLVLLFFEGFLRTFAALAGDTLGMLPFLLVAVCQDAWDRRAKAGAKAKDKAIGPPVVDLVEELGDDALRVHSCRPKPHWHPYVSVRYRDELYGPVREERAEDPRPFVYDLRRRKASDPVVVVYEYHPARGEDQPGEPKGSPVG